MNNSQNANQFQNYQIISELGRHQEGIYINYLAIIVGFIGLGSDVDLIMGFVAGLVISCIAAMMIKFYREKNCSDKIAVTLALLTASFGLSFGLDLTFTNGNSLLLLLILVTGFPLILMLLNPYWQYQKRMNSYRKQERFLIKS